MISVRTRAFRTLRAGFAAMVLLFAVLVAGLLAHVVRSMPGPPPPNAGSGRIGPVLEETVRTASPATLRAHLDSVAGSTFCIVGYTIRDSLRELGVDPSDIPNYALDSDLWAYVVTRPSGPQEYAVVGTGRIWPSTARQCWAAARVDLLVARRLHDGAQSIYLAVEANSR